MQKITYSTIPEFEKDIKTPKKRFPTLGDDLEIAKKHAIELKHIRSLDNRSIFEIPECCTETIRICKLKKFACKSLKGRGNQSGIRVIYAFFRETTSVEFLEIYFKGDKATEDRGRIKKYLELNDELPNPPSTK